MREEIEERLRRTAVDLLVELDGTWSTEDREQFLSLVLDRLKRTGHLSRQSRPRSQYVALMLLCMRSPLTPNNVPDGLSCLAAVIDLLDPACPECLRMYRLADEWTAVRLLPPGVTDSWEVVQDALQAIRLTIEERRLLVERATSSLSSVLPRHSTTAWSDFLHVAARHRAPAPEPPWMTYLRAASPRTDPEHQQRLEAILEREAPAAGGLPPCPPPQNAPAAAPATNDREQEGSVHEDAGLTPGGGTPAIWGSVPLRNPNFTGRDSLLAVLHERLRKNNAAAVLPSALHGMGGVGKSTLAVEYIYRHLRDYDVVWWIPAERTTEITLSLASLAPQLGIDTGGEATATVARVLEELRRGKPYGRWLLVFDNADNPESVRHYFPSGGPGDVLVTSRNPQWAGVAPPLEVDVFRREESVALLRGRGPEITNDEADRLAQALGDLPLAIVQAAAWRAETGMPADEYLRLLDEKRVELLSLAAPLDYQQPVIAAWNVSLDHLESENPAALRLLQLCAFCAPEAIPRDLFVSHPGGSITPELDAVLRDPIHLGQAIRAIGRFSLARWDFPTRSLQIHRLIQVALISRMTESEQQTMRQGVHLLLSTNDPNDPHNASDWPRYGELYPHVIVSGAVRSTDPYVRKLVINQVIYLLRWGNIEAALQLARSAYESWRSGGGENAPATLEVSKWLGAALASMGRHAESAAVNARVLDAYRRTVGEDHEDTLDAWGNVAIDLRAKGKFAAALELSESVHQRYLRLLGPDDPETLRAAHNLGVSLRLSGEFARARELDTDTLRNKTTTFGQDHVLTLVTWLGLILDIQELDGYQTALTHLRELTGQAARLLGRDNPLSLAAHRHLAVTLRHAGRYEEALAVAERTRAGVIRRYGESGPESVASTLTLAMALREAGKVPAAHDLGAWIHRQYADIYGPVHPHTLSAEMNLALTHRLLGDAEAARAVHERTLADFSRVLGARHPSSVACAINLASDLHALGEYSAAETLDGGTLAVSTDVLGPNHPSTLACGVNLTLDLRAQGHREEAERLLAATMERLTRVLGAEHPLVHRVQARKHRVDCGIDPMPL
ncbi:hypothetical protein BN159_1056 [Streptomyces davaonensis JCM 4913]|uniref:Uncharacterized protein n=1 Tax=Streptomyces davaonensis (strain DSM 101723 / JCM 4913 / KCC S-0913 / 768) TaxID=1214101 RepID=K4QX83_STRDJ|nr:FxSxx-COOH system tetratricopeptide repeat protein [Streptomyces davaonensis]CCK25435.1 hypothetical protein BN159_1056 [Streptomyces davaonensis JCM 4913]